MALETQIRNTLRREMTLPQYILLKREIRRVICCRYACVCVCGSLINIHRYAHSQCGRRPGFSPAATPPHTHTHMALCLGSCLCSLCCRRALHVYGNLPPGLNGIQLDHSVSESGSCRLDLERPPKLHWSRQAGGPVLHPLSFAGRLQTPHRSPWIFP